MKQEDFVPSYPGLFVVEDKKQLERLKSQSVGLVRTKIEMLLQLKERPRTSVRKLALECSVNPKTIVKWKQAYAEGQWHFCRPVPKRLPLTNQLDVIIPILEKAYKTKLTMKVAYSTFLEKAGKTKVQVPKAQFERFVRRNKKTKIFVEVLHHDREENHFKVVGGIKRSRRSLQWY